MQALIKENSVDFVSANSRTIHLFTSNAVLYNYTSLLNWNFYFLPADAPLCFAKCINTKKYLKCRKRSIFVMDTMHCGNSYGSNEKISFVIA